MCRQVFRHVVRSVTYFIPNIHHLVTVYSVKGRGPPLGQQIEPFAAWMKWRDSSGDGE